MIKNVFNNLRAGIKNHWLALIVAFFLGLTLISPHLVALKTAGEDFRGIYPSFSDDEIYYQARVREVIDGHFAIGNPYIKEHENDPFIQPPVAEWIIAFIARATHLSVPLVSMLSDLFFPFIGFVVLYFLLWRVAENKIASTFFSFLFFIFFLQTFGRPISPQLNFIFLISGLFVIIEIYFNREMSHRNVKTLNLLAGAIIGVTMFISPYYWTSLILLYFLLIFSQAFIERSFAFIKKTLTWFSFAFAPLFLVYAAFYFRSSKILSYVESSERFGLIRSHLPGSFSAIALGILTGALLFLVRKHLSVKKIFFLASLVLSIFVLNWQNIITGQYLQFSSHYLLVTVLYVLIVLAVVSIEMLNQQSTRIAPRYFSVLVTVFILSLLALLAFKQKSEIKRFISDYSFDRTALVMTQQKADVFNWLNKNTPPGSVVYSLGGNYDFLIPVYTKNKVYYNFYANLYLMHNSETEDRWIIQNLFNKSFDKDFIVEHQRDFWGNRFLDSYQFKENRKKISSFLIGREYTPSEQFNQDEIVGLEQRFLEFVEKDFYGAIKTFQVDYILIGHDYPFYKDTVEFLSKTHKISLILDINSNKVYKVE